MGAIVSSQKKFLQRHSKQSNIDQRKKKRLRHLVNGKDGTFVSAEMDVAGSKPPSDQAGLAATTQSSKRYDKRRASNTNGDNNQIGSRRNSNHGHNSLRRSKHEIALHQLPQPEKTLTILPFSSWHGRYRFHMVDFSCFIDDKETTLVEKNSVLKYKTPHFRASAKVEVPPVPEGKQLVVGWIQVVRSMTFVNLYGDLGITSWEFPEITTGKQRMISDSDGHRYPWYGARKEVFSVRGPRTSPTLVSVSMNDNFSPQVTWHIPAPNPKRAPRDPRLTRVYRQQAFTTCLAVMEVDDIPGNSPVHVPGATRCDVDDDAATTVATTTTKTAAKFTNNNNNIVQQQQQQQQSNNCNSPPPTSTSATIFTPAESGGVTSFRTFAIISTTTTATSTTTTATTTTASATKTITATAISYRSQQTKAQDKTRPNFNVRQHEQHWQEHHFTTFKHDHLTSCQTSFTTHATSNKILQQQKQLKGICLSEPKIFQEAEGDSAFSTSWSRGRMVPLRSHCKQHIPFPNKHLESTASSQRQIFKQYNNTKEQEDISTWLAKLKLKPVTSFASSPKLSISSSSSKINVSTTNVLHSTPTSSSSPSSPSSSSSNHAPTSSNHVMILKAVDWCMEIEIAVDPNQPVGNRARLINRTSSRFSKPELIHDAERLGDIIDSSALFPPNANRSQVLVWRPFQTTEPENIEKEAAQISACPEPMTSSLPPPKSSPSSSSSSPSSSLSSSSLVTSSLPLTRPSNVPGIRNENVEQPTLLSITRTFFPSSPSSSSSSSSSSSPPLPQPPPPLPTQSIYIPPPPTIVVKPNQTTVEMSDYFRLTSHISESLFEAVVL